jgi:hypothetical protein
VFLEDIEVVQDDYSSENGKYGMNHSTSWFLFADASRCAALVNGELNLARQKPTDGGQRP